jgi:hypothetical protein
MSTEGRCEAAGRRARRGWLPEKEAEGEAEYQSWPEPVRGRREKGEARGK